MCYLIQNLNSTVIREKVNKANNILGIIKIKRNFKYLSREAFALAYKTMVQPHPEYALQLQKILH